MTRWVTPLALVALSTVPSGAQYVTFSAPGSTTITFDTLPTSGTTNAWTNGTTVNGVYAFQSLPAPAAVTTITASTGTGTAGALYSFGTGTDAERALGSVGSNAAGHFAYGVVLRNAGADPLAVSLAYDGEQWRDAGNTTPQKLDFAYRASAAAPTAVADWAPASVTPTGYTELNALDFTGPVATASAGPLDGNDAANRVSFASTGLAAVNPGEFLALRWWDLNDGGSDHGLAIDNLVVTVAPVPEPAGVLAMGLAAVGLFRLARRRRQSLG
jgi:hypothetical protein